MAGFSAYLHGVELREEPLIPSAPAEQRTSVIGLVGVSPFAPEGKLILVDSPQAGLREFGNKESWTAAKEETDAEIKALDERIKALGENPDADELKALTEQKTALAVLLTRYTAAIGSSALETIQTALDLIFSQGPALVVALNVLKQGGGTTLADYNDEVAGSEAALTGLYKLLEAEDAVGYKPKVLIAPYFSENAAVRTSMEKVAGELRGVALIDIDSTLEPTAAIATVRDLTSSRLYALYPRVKLTFKPIEEAFPMSALVAGAVSYNDAQNGFFSSPSNKQLKGVAGLSRLIRFSLDDPNSDANRLNEKGIATIVRQSGFRLWGARTLGKGNKVDEANVFLNVRRTSDVLNEALIELALKRIDENITRNFVEVLVEDMNSYLRELKRRGAILGGECIFDKNDNPTSQLTKGILVLRVEYSAAYPAEQIKIIVSLTDKYLAEVLNNG